MAIEFDHPKERSSIIKVFGVGGGGSNAVNHMFLQGIKGVDFVVANTDRQALELSPVPTKIHLGPAKTSGLGAGANPDVGRDSTIESLDEVTTVLNSNTRMLFITVGMGGGTGTGGAPEIARVARDMGILTVGIVTTPFTFEGNRRIAQAKAGIDEMKKHVDTLIVIANDKIREVYGNLKMSEAFANADNVLTTAARGIAEIITVAGYINVDFEDVNTVMRNSGVAIMGTGKSKGENRAINAVKDAICSPLLNENNVQGARNILLNITSGTDELSMDEICQINDYVQNEAGQNADIIWGNCTDESLDEYISVTLIATGFDKENQSDLHKNKEEIEVIHLDETAPLENPFTAPAPFAKEDAAIAQNDAVEEKVHFSAQTQEDELITDDANAQYSIDFEVKDARVENNEEMRIEEEPVEMKIQETEEIQMERSVDDFDFTKQSPAPSNQNRKAQSAEDTLSADDREELEKLRADNDRRKKLKAMSIKLSALNKDVKDLEAEPAFKRKNVELDDIPHSSETNVSTMMLDESQNGIKRNSWLHDQPD